MKLRARMRRWGWVRLQFVLIACTALGLVAPKDGLAGEVLIPVAKSESSYPASYKGELVAVVDEDEQDGTHGPIKLFRYTDTRNTKLEYTIADLRKGMVLIRALGKDLMTMRSPAFDEAAGGTIEIVFYREFLGSDRRRVDVGYRMELDDRWVVRTEDQRGRDSFDRIRVQVGFQLGAPTHVKEIRLLSDEAGTSSPIRIYDARELPRHQTQKQQTIPSL
jgi:hypothetical protein